MRPGTWGFAPSKVSGLTSSRQQKLLGPWTIEHKSCLGRLSLLRASLTQDTYISKKSFCSSIENLYLGFNILSLQSSWFYLDKNHCLWKTFRYGVDMTFLVVALVECWLHGHVDIWYCWTEKAFDDDGNLKQPKQLSINKVGHALHEIDPVFKKFSCSEKLSSLLLSLDYKRPVIIQSMYIFKNFFYQFFTISNS
ncbi:hypothetical protein HYC85_023484 [Camellia sinensis]|uniref:Uncharacterized protein n=1 Tax=Camellia sinensis TaxID=4442 RepID=A0A7J7GFZ3_CAMSI|nr:hypothetical protein HYC85_023484 [Camellia sinensis]